MEQVYSYNPGAHTKPAAVNHYMQYTAPDARRTDLPLSFMQTSRV